MHFKKLERLKLILKNISEVLELTNVKLGLPLDPFLMLVHASFVTLNVTFQQLVALVKKISLRYAVQNMFKQYPFPFFALLFPFLFSFIIFP